MLVPTPFDQLGVGSEEWKARAAAFRDALHVACSKFESEEAVRGIARIAEERGDPWTPSEMDAALKVVSKRYEEKA